MSTGAFFKSFGAWLLDEPVHASLLLVLGFLQLILWGYMLVRDARLRSRVLSVELRHQGLMEKLIMSSADLHALRRDTQDRLDEITNPKHAGSKG